MEGPRRARTPRPSGILVRLGEEGRSGGERRESERAAEAEADGGCLSLELAATAARYGQQQQHWTAPRQQGHVWFQQTRHRHPHEHPQGVHARRCALQEKACESLHCLHLGQQVFQRVLGESQGDAAEGQRCGFV